MADLIYTTVDDFLAMMSEQALTELTDDFRTGEIDLDVLAKAEAQAIAEVERYAAQYYTLPLASVPSVKALVLPLTKYWLYARRGTVRDDVQEMYKATMRSLEKLTAESLGLPGIERAAGNSAGVSVSSEAERFGSNFMGLDL